MEKKGMTREKWERLSDDEKTKYMRNAFRNLQFGEKFDYAALRKHHERLIELDKNRFENYGVYQNPCLVLEIFDPIMAPMIMDWMFSKLDDEGNLDNDGSPAPLFGYMVTDLCFDVKSLMEFNEEEKSILREAMRIIYKRVAGMPDVWNINLENEV